jgi:predicted RNase H-like nuclease
MGDSPAHLGTRLNELIGKVPDAAIIGVDMPLGLVDSGERDADRVVKRKLGHKPIQMSCDKQFVCPGTAH